MKPAPITSKTARIKETVKLENPNYLILYLDLSNAQPEKFDIILQQGKDKKVIPYEIKQRKAGSSERVGFNSSDVCNSSSCRIDLRSGNPTNDVIPGMRETKVDRNQQYARHGGDFQRGSR